MQAIESHPETQRCTSADQAVESAPRAHSSWPADVALTAAILAPLAILGVLVLIGIGVGIAVCIVFVSVFAVTTTLDVRWFLRCRRDRNDSRRARE